MDERRFLSKIAGKIEKSTIKLFKGVFTIDTIPMAESLRDLNSPNLFFINVDGYFIAIFNSASHCIVIDGVSINSFHPSIQTFVDVLRDGLPVATLPFKMVDRRSSMILCLLFAVMFAEGTLYVETIISRFGFKRNSYAKNHDILVCWFNSRYT